MDKHQPEATHTLRHKYHFAVRADPTEKYATGKEPGRADLLVARAGRAFYIECKTGGSSFAFGEWRENQRQWYFDYCIAPPYQMEMYLWLWMGTDPPNWNPERYSPRKSWIIPVPAFLEIESVVRLYQDSIPYRVQKGYSRALQDNKLDAITLFAPYELKWLGGGVWEIPDSHPVHVKWIAPIETTKGDAA